MPPLVCGKDIALMRILLDSFALRRVLVDDTTRRGRPFLLSSTFTSFRPLWRRLNPFLQLYIPPSRLATQSQLRNGRAPGRSPTASTSGSSHLSFADSPRTSRPEAGSACHLASLSLSHHPTPTRSSGLSTPRKISPSTTFPCCEKNHTPVVSLVTLRNNAVLETVGRVRVCVCEPEA